MSQFRRPVYLNPDAARFQLDASPADSDALSAFHASLPDHAPTPLVPLPDLAKELGLKAVFIKDESQRFGLPSFKILGASWGVYLALCARFELPLDTPLRSLAEKAKDIRLYACTDGNHGRAVARMAKYLNLKCNIYVPRTLDSYTKGLIASEGSEVIVSSGDYDTAVKEAFEAAGADENGILIQDTAFEGYTEIPIWIVEGYAAMLKEADAQLEEMGLQATTIVTPVGVGSLAHAVVKHAKAANPPRTVVAVEPDTAACIHKSLLAGKATSITTSYTTMTGMECGSPSSTAWPDLQKGLDASVTISDFESHQALLYLQDKQVNAGPCGSGTLAGLKHLKAGADLLSSDSVVVLLSTEGHRPYKTPLDVSNDDCVTLTQQLVSIDSSNVTLSEEPGAGEVEIAGFVAAWLEHRGIETHWIEGTPGRPSVVGVVRGSDGGKSLMLNGHIDTVSLAGYKGDPLSGKRVQHGGKEVIEGRGGQDMKAGIAAAMATLLKAKALGDSLKGDVILAAVSDEEDASLGTQDIIKAGWKADAAIIMEPTDLKVGVSHKGFVWIEIEVLGVAAHGSRPAEGVDAIMNVSYALDALRQYSSKLPSHKSIGQASLHCGRIHGGTETSTYPASCKMTVEFRTIPSQTPEQLLEDMKQMLRDISEQHSDFKHAEPQLLLHRPAYELDMDGQLANLAREILVTEKEAVKEDFVSVSFWCDAALLGEAGTPSVVMGPVGGGLHSEYEWVDVDSIIETERRLVAFMNTFCC